MITCPCCGREMAAPRSPVEALTDAALDPQERMILAALVRAYPRYLTKPALVDAFYADDPDGGPLDVGNVLSVRISSIRKIIARHGWTVSLADTGRGAQGRWRLEALPC